MYMYKEVNLHYVNLKLYMYEKQIVKKQINIENVQYTVI